MGGLPHLYLDEELEGSQGIYLIIHMANPPFVLLGSLGDRETALPRLAIRRGGDFSNSPTRSTRYDERRRSSHDQQSSYAGKRSQSIERPSSSWKSRTATQHECRLRSRSRSRSPSVALTGRRNSWDRGESGRPRLQEHSWASSFRSDTYRRTSCERVPSRRSPSPVIPASRRYERRLQDHNNTASLTRKQMVGRLTRDVFRRESVDYFREHFLDSSNRHSQSPGRHQDDPKRNSNRAEEPYDRDYAASHVPKATNTRKDYSRMSSSAPRYPHSRGDVEKEERRNSAETSTVQSNRRADPLSLDSSSSRSLGSRWCPPRAAEGKAGSAARLASFVSATGRDAVSPRGHDSGPPEDPGQDRKEWRSSITLKGSASALEPGVSRLSGHGSAQKSFPAAANNHLLGESSQRQQEQGHGGQEPTSWHGRTPIFPQSASSQLLSAQSPMLLTARTETPLSSHQKDQNGVISQRPHTQVTGGNSDNPTLPTERQPSTAPVLVSAARKPTAIAKKQTTTKSSYGNTDEMVKANSQEKVINNQEDRSDVWDIWPRCGETASPHREDCSKAETFNFVERKTKRKPCGRFKRRRVQHPSPLVGRTDTILKPEVKADAGKKTNVKKSQRPMKKRFIRESSPEQTGRSSSTSKDANAQPNIENSGGDEVQKEPSKQLASARSPSPSANANHRTVTDSEGGSTVSGINRDVAVSAGIVRMEKKCDSVPCAIVPGNVVDMAGSTPDLTADDSLTASMDILDQSPATRVPDVIVPQNGGGHGCPEDDDTLLDSPTASNGWHGP